MLPAVGTLLTKYSSFGKGEGSSPSLDHPLQCQNRTLITQLCLILNSTDVWAKRIASVKKTHRWSLALKCLALCTPQKYSGLHYLGLSNTGTVKVYGIFSYKNNVIWSDHLMCVLKAHSASCPSSGCSGPNEILWIDEMQSLQQVLEQTDTACQHAKMRCCAAVEECQELLEHCKNLAANSVSYAVLDFGAVFLTSYAQHCTVT